jgi:nitrogen fixation NifU-like protein
MSTDIDLFIRRFQEEIIRAARKTYGETFFQRWQNPLYQGRVENADVAAELKGQCGDTIAIYLKFENNSVRQASFETDGCAPSIVCGSMAAELTLGKTPEGLLDITAETIIQRIGGLPEEVQHCAFLAAAVVHSAVDRYMIKQISKDKGAAA